MIPKLLNSTIDSLDLRLFSHSAASAWLTSQIPDFRQYKNNFDYSKNSEPFYIDFPDLGRFKLLHVGHPPYEFVFSNEEVGEIYLAAPEKFLSKFSINTGQLFLNFRSKFLQCQSDDYGLVDEFVANCFSNFFGKFLNSWVKVSRADLAADFSGVSFDWQDLSKLSTRARKKEGLNSFCSFSDLEEVRGILSELRPQTGNKGVSNVTSQNNHYEKLTPKHLDILLELTDRALNDGSVSRAIFAKNLQTAYIGRFGSKLYSRIYLKSAEIKVSGKDYLEPYWLEKGCQKEDSVWRVEFSLSGDFLKEFHDLESGDNLHHWQDFKKNIPKIWNYCTKDWMRHTTSENSLNSRSPNSEFWDCVTTAFPQDLNFCRLPIPAPPSEFLAAQILAQAKGCLRTFAALIIGGYNRAFGTGEKWADQEEVMQILIDEIGNDLNKDITFQQIQDRRSKYGCDDFSDTAFSAALRKSRMNLGKGS